MLEYSHGEIGWDVFTLEYKVGAPIDTVLDPDSMVKYLKLFNHLWQMKRIEGTLNVGWMRIAGGARTFLRVPGKSTFVFLTALNRIAELDPQWHQIRIVMAEMIHFMRQMQAYCQLEVIECSWKVLLDFLNKKEGDLDAMIEAHRTYLDRMVKKVLLLSPKSGKQVRCLLHWPNCFQISLKESLLNQVKEVFSTILMFRDATVGCFPCKKKNLMSVQDNFYYYCLSESSRRDGKLDEQRVSLLTHPAHWY